MNFPDFDDFLSQMGEARFEEWANSANKQIALIPNLASQEGANQFFNHTIQSSMLISVAMMRDYHEWLISELSKKSLRLL